MQTIIIVETNVQFGSIFVNKFKNICFTLIIITELTNNYREITQYLNLKHLGHLNLA